MKQIINRTSKHPFILAVLLLLSYGATAQNTSLKVGDNSTKKDPSAVLEIESATKGALLPRVKLTGTAIASPVSSPAEGLTVYNTNTVGDVLPGYYYWSSTTSKWIRLLTLNDNNIYWSLKGNAGTNPATDFIGTTDQKDLVFRTGNLRSGFISGTDDPDFSGTVRPNLLGGTAFGFKALKNEALNSPFTSTGSVAFGQSALEANTTGINNAAMGSFALSNNTTGIQNIAVGSAALMSNVTGNFNTAVGFRAFAGGLGNNNTLMGNSAGRVESGNNGSGLGDNNTLIGVNSGYNLNGSSNNTALGYDALHAINYGSNNVAIGAYSGIALRNGANNVFLGTNADGISGRPVGTPNNAVAIGYNAKVGADNSMVLGGTGADALNVGIGMTVPSNALHVKATSNPVRFEGLQATGTAADQVVVADGTGVLKTVTTSVLVPATTVSNTVTGNSLSTTVNGKTGDPVNIINSNVLGLGTDNKLTSTVNGVTSNSLDLSTAITNNQKNSTVSAGSNTSVAATPAGSNTTNYAISVATASGTTLGVVKEAATAPTVRINAAGELAIDPGSVASGLGKNFTSSDFNITGGTGATLTAVTANIKDGAVTPTKMANSPAANQVLTSDANKAPVWVNTTDFNTNNWSTLGNKSTNPATNFLGTTDAQDLAFRTNNLERLRITQTGRLDFSNTSGTSSNLFIEGGNETATGGFNNTAVGFRAGLMMTSASSNTLYGMDAGNNITSGSSNTTIGNGAGTNITSGSSNIAIGQNTSVVNATGNNQLNIGNGIFGTGFDGSMTNTKVGIGVNAPSNTLHVNATANPVRLQGLQNGAETDNIVVVDNTGVLRQIKSVMPRFFAMPPVMLPTAPDQVAAGDPNIQVDGAGTYTVNLYNLYNSQYGGTFPTTASNSGKVSNPTKNTSLPVYAANQLDYYITFFDTTVFTNVAVDDTGKMTYKISTADVGMGSFMHIVFAVKP